MSLTVGMEGSVASVKRRPFHPNAHRVMRWALAVGIGGGHWRWALRGIGGGHWRLALDGGWRWSGGRVGMEVGSGRCCGGSGERVRHRGGRVALCGRGGNLWPAAFMRRRSPPPQAGIADLLGARRVVAGLALVLIAEGAGRPVAGDRRERPPRLKIGGQSFSARSACENSLRRGSFRADSRTVARRLIQSK